MSSVDPTMFVSHFMQFIFTNAPFPVNLIMDNIWIAVISEIWRHKNNHLFKGGVVDHSEIFFFGTIKGLVMNFFKDSFCGFFLL